MSKTLTPGEAVRRELRSILSDALLDEDTVYVPEEMLSADEYEQIAKAAIAASANGAESLADSLQDATKSLGEIVSAATELLHALDVAGVSNEQVEKLRGLI